jgi:hypothetical protein
MYLSAMKNIEKIRLCVLCSLVFCFMAGGCYSGSETMEDVTIYYEFAKAKRIDIARRLLTAIPEDSIKNLVYIKRAVEGAPRILGEYYIKDKVVLFEPLIPFTPGLTYQLFIRDKKHSDIVIPAEQGTTAPVVTNIYPSQDTLPENLLKIYIHFSQSMQEGVSADHICLVKGENDTLKNVFLDLQPELWNHDRTMLTLWLDPGRIKRDLQPNQQLGAPLTAGTHYRVVVKPGWQNGNGAGMEKIVEKKFYTVGRDSISPDPALWTIVTPKGNLKEVLEIHMHEPLDYQLLNSVIRVLNSAGGEVAGEVILRADESTWSFVPKNPWPVGTYTIEVESKLEDLAGNNLNRLFDTDLAKPQKKNQQDIYRLPFNIK